MDFTNEINTLESEKLRLEEMLKRNNDRLQLLKEASTEPSSDGYRRFFKLKGYSLLYTGGERLNHERFIFNCTLVSTAGHLSRKYWNVEELSKKLEGAKEISKEEFIKWATEYQQRKINNINSDYTQLFKHINSIPDDGKEHLVSGQAMIQLLERQLREISMFIKQGRLYGIIFLLVILEDITMLLYVPIKQFL